jgi:hypothetical protein
MDELRIPKTFSSPAAAKLSLLWYLELEGCGLDSANAMAPKVTARVATGPVPLVATVLGAAVALAYRSVGPGAADQSVYFHYAEHRSRRYLVSSHVLE